MPLCDLVGVVADEQHSQYSKLLLASKEQVLRRVVQEEKAALERQLAEEKHTPESCFIEAAIQELKVTGSPGSGGRGWKLATSAPPTFEMMSREQLRKQICSGLW